MKLPDIAEDLYAHSPDTFIDARNRQVKQLRDEGHAALARDVAQLKRPTTAAAFLNVLARACDRPLDDLLSLGASLRKVQAELDHDGLRNLGRKRHDYFSVLSDKARFGGRSGQAIQPAGCANVTRHVSSGAQRSGGGRRRP